MTLTIKKLIYGYMMTMSVVNMLGLIMTLTQDYESPSSVFTSSSLMEDSDDDQYNDDNYLPMKDPISDVLKLQQQHNRRHKQNNPSNRGGNQIQEDLLNHRLYKSSYKKHLALPSQTKASLLSFNSSSSSDSKNVQHLELHDPSFSHQKQDELHERLFQVNCSQLLVGQYKCSSPIIDPETQEPFGCNENNLAKVNCSLISGLICLGTNSGRFSRDIPCRYTNGYSFETALLLSIFLGMFGADRFYLGYPALGLLKFTTLGFLFLGQLVDIILIAMQIVTPSDGSNYVIKYYGPRLEILSYVGNETDLVNGLGMDKHMHLEWL